MKFLSPRDDKKHSITSCTTPHDTHFITNSTPIPPPNIHIHHPFHTNIHQINYFHRNILTIPILTKQPSPSHIPSIIPLKYHPSKAYIVYCVEAKAFASANPSEHVIHCRILEEFSYI